MKNLWNKVLLFLRIRREYTTEEILSNLQEADENHVNEVVKRLQRLVDKGISNLGSGIEDEDNMDTLTYLKGQLDSFPGPRSCALVIQEVCKMRRVRPEIFEETRQLGKDDNNN